MTDREIVIRLHDIARNVEQYGASNLDAKEIRLIADRFSNLSQERNTLSDTSKSH